MRATGASREFTRSWFGRRIDPVIAVRPREPAFRTSTAENGDPVSTKNDAGWPFKVTLTSRWFCSLRTQPTEEGATVAPFAVATVPASR